MQRQLLGIIALVLLTAGAVGLFLGFSTHSQSAMAAGIGLRAGLVLGALWMAYPQLIRLARYLPGWLLGAILLGGMVVVVQPRTLPLVAVAMAAAGVLQMAGSLLRLRPSGPRGSRPGPARRRPGPNQLQSGAGRQQSAQIPRGARPTGPTGTSGPPRGSDVLP